MSQRFYSRGPLSMLDEVPSVGSVDARTLHRLLLAYYRILHANKEWPRLSRWPLKYLSRIIWEPHPDPGARFLAIRCYALQSGMIEAERKKMEKQAIGDIDDTDCPIEYEAGVDGSRHILDGWTLPAHEAQRVFEARQALLIPQKYYTYEQGDSVEPIHPAELRYVLVPIYYNVG